MKFIRLGLMLVALLQITSMQAMLRRTTARAPKPHVPTGMHQRFNQMRHSATQAPETPKPNEQASWADRAKRFARTTVAGGTAMGVGAAGTYAMTHEQLKAALEAQESTEELRRAQEVAEAKATEASEMAKQQEVKREEAEQQAKAAKEKAAAEESARKEAEQQITDASEKAKKVLEHLQTAQNKDLLTAVRSQDISVVKKLLTGKDDFAGDVRPTNIDEALKAALKIKSGWFWNTKRDTIIRDLVEAGANVETAYQWAVKNDNTDMLKWIHTNHSTPDRSFTTLNLAAQKGSVELARLAMDHATDNSKGSALLTATNAGHKGFIEQMLKENLSIPEIKRAQLAAISKPEIHKIFQEHLEQRAAEVSMPREAAQAGASPELMK